MISQTMVQPSYWIECGVKLQKIRGLNLFKFTDELQNRLEILIDRQKANLLTPTETAELAGITESIFHPDECPHHCRVMTISIASRKRVRERANFLCEYCHSSEEASASLFTLDHLTNSIPGGNRHRK